MGERRAGHPVVVAAVDGIREEAAFATGLDDFGDGWFLRPLAAWVEDLSQPMLNDFGRRFLRSQAVRDVSRRLRVLDMLRRHPEIAAVPIPPVLYITGLERSGTTLLHNLLARHRAARALLRWELMDPVPPQAADDGPDPRIARAQAAVDKLRGSALEPMHWVNADEPEECAWGFIDAVSMLGQSASFWMPRWRRFLIEEDPTPAYEHYRRVVQLLLWQRPVPPGSFLVLKSPQIARHIAASAAVFPEAHFVVVDRDPFRCTVSMAALAHLLVEPFSVATALADDGYAGQVVLAWAKGKLGALDAFTTACPDRISHVAYPDLVADAAGTAQRVVASGGLPADDRLAGQIAEWLDSQRAGGRVAPPPELPAVGYRPDGVLADPTIDRYYRRFGVRPEERRLTGIHFPA